MAIFYDSDEKHNFFPKRDRPLDGGSIQMYADEFGNERALGYMEAMRDFNNQLKVMLGGGYSYTGVPIKPAKLRKSVQELFHNNDFSLHVFIQNQEKLDP